MSVEGVEINGVGDWAITSFTGKVTNRETEKPMEKAEFDFLQETDLGTYKSQVGAEQVLLHQLSRKQFS